MSISVKNAQGASVSLKTTTVGSEEIPHHILDPGSAEIGKVAIAAATTVNTGQEAVTASAVQFNGGTSLIPKGKILVKAPAANAQVSYIGGAAVSPSNGFALDPGDIVEVDISNINKLYHIGAVSDKLTWICNV